MDNINIIEEEVLTITEENAIDTSGDKFEYAVFYFPGLDK